MKIETILNFQESISPPKTSVLTKYNIRSTPNTKILSNLFSLKSTAPTIDFVQVDFNSSTAWGGETFCTDKEIYVTDVVGKKYVYLSSNLISIELMLFNETVFSHKKGTPTKFQGHLSIFLISVLSDLFK